MLWYQVPEISGAYNPVGLLLVYMSYSPDWLVITTLRIQANKAASSTFLVT